MKQMLDLEPKGEISNEVGSHPMCSLYTASLFKKLLEIQIEKPASCLDLFFFFFKDLHIKLEQEQQYHYTYAS